MTYWCNAQVTGSFCLDFGDVCIHAVCVCSMQMSSVSVYRWVLWQKTSVRPSWYFPTNKRCVCVGKVNQQFWSCSLLHLYMVPFACKHSVTAIATSNDLHCHYVSIMLGFCNIAFKLYLIIYMWCENTYSLPKVNNSNWSSTLNVKKNETKK